VVWADLDASSLAKGSAVLGGSDPLVGGARAIHVALMLHNIVWGNCLAMTLNTVSDDAGSTEKCGQAVDDGGFHIGGW
jgi:hypothetical protein